MNGSVKAPNKNIKDLIENDCNTLGLAREAPFCSVDLSNFNPLHYRGNSIFLVYGMEVV